MKFNQPYITGMEAQYITEAMTSGKLQSGGKFTATVKAFLSESLSARQVHLVHSCTAALEIAALALDVKAGDEVIMPSYTYVSTANAFALRGARVKFVDVDPLTMCLDLDCVEKALTTRTKVVVAVHYASASCDMDRLMQLSVDHDFFVVEDAAQSIYAHYKGRALGTIGHIGCISCHETKNIHAGGEGGILLVNDGSFDDLVEQIIEKGTNRNAFLNHDVSKYTWQTLGSSYGMSELHCAFLYGQLLEYETITQHRRKLVKAYIDALSVLKNIGVELFSLPNYNDGNGHLCYIKVSSELERTVLRRYLSNLNIETASHYEPLHTSNAGRCYGEFMAYDQFTTLGAKRLVRLPVHMALKEADVIKVCKLIKQYYHAKGVASCE